MNVVGSKAVTAPRAAFADIDLPDVFAEIDDGSPGLSSASINPALPRCYRDTLSHYDDTVRSGAVGRCFPETMSMAAKLMAHHAAAARKGVNQLRVGVHGFGFNPLEIGLWLELGIPVVAVENSAARANAGRVLAQHPGKDRLEWVDSNGPLPDDIDVSVWISPMPSFEFHPERLWEHLRPGALCVIQTDYHLLRPRILAAQTKGAVAVFQGDMDLDNIKYFIPSPHLFQYDPSSLTVMQRR